MSLLFYKFIPTDIVIKKGKRIFHNTVDFSYDTSFLLPMLHGKALFTRFRDVIEPGNVIYDQTKYLTELPLYKVLLLYYYTINGYKFVNMHSRGEKYEIKNQDPLFICWCIKTQNDMTKTLQEYYEEYESLTCDKSIFIEYYISILDEIIIDSPRYKESVTVYRGTKKYTKNHIGFVSTTHVYMDRFSGKDCCKYIITIPANFPALNLIIFDNYEEQEVLLPSITQFVETEKKIPEIYVRAILDIPIGNPKPLKKTKSLLEGFSDERIRECIQQILKYDTRFLNREELEFLFIKPSFDYGEYTVVKTVKKGVDISESVWDYVNFQSLPNPIFLMKYEIYLRRIIHENPQLKKKLATFYGKNVTFQNKHIFLIFQKVLQTII